MRMAVARPPGPCADDRHVVLHGLTRDVGFDQFVGSHLFRRGPLGLESLFYDMRLERSQQFSKSSR